MKVVITSQVTIPHLRKSGADTVIVTVYKDACKAEDKYTTHDKVVVFQD